MKQDQLTLKRNKYKDDKPENTVYKIRGILKDIGIITYEASWEQLSNYCYSVRVEIDGLQGVGVNGKGVTRSYALASAYGELMERIQNRHLMPRIYGLLPREKLSFPDEFQLNYVDILNNVDLLKHIINDYKTNQLEIEELFSTYSSLSFGVPFFHVNKNEIANIPSRLLNFAIGTNGMCAGNSSEEAIIHGICELFERHVIKKIIFEELSLPDIPIKTVSNILILNTIKHICARGYRVILKDCTLGGRLPVVGVLIINKLGNKYTFHLGSDPVFEIALERCFTEMFQGNSLERFNTSMQPIDWDTRNYNLEEKQKFFEGICNNGVGQFPNSIFHKSDNSNNYVDHPFLNNMKDNKDGLKHLISLVIHENYQLYIRDLSFLNFPTYKVYIPGISEIYPLTSKSIKGQFDRSAAARTVLNIEISENGSLQKLMVALEKENATNFGNTILFKRMSINLTNDAQLLTLNRHHLMIAICIKSGEYGKAFYFLKDLIKRERIEEYSNASYYMCCLAFLKYKSLGLSDELIKEYLLQVYEIDVVSEVLADLLLNKDSLKNLNLPNCPECEICPINYSCNHIKYSEITSALINRMNNNWIDQTTLKEVFSFEKNMV